MRYRLMASYGGSPFEAGVGPTDGDVVLFAACPPPEELGFEPATGHWRKQLRLDQVEAIWESRPVGVFRGEPCMVLDDLGDRLHIGYLGHNGYKAEQLGYWQVDRGVFELVAPRAEVAEVVERQTDYTQTINPDQPAQGPEAPASAPGYQLPAGQPSAGQPPAYEPGSPAYQLRAEPGGVTLPVSPAAPLPLEAQAMRAASASRRAAEPGDVLDRGLPGALPAEPGAALNQGLPGALPAEPGAALNQGLPAAVPTEPQQTRAEPAKPGQTQAEPARSGATRSEPSKTRRMSARGGTRRRLATEQLFAELASQAGIPASSYSFGKAVEGAFCLVRSAAGFEVFHCADGAHHEVHVFASEESACFYLFGMLAADAVRTGRLVSMPPVPASL